MGFSVKSMYLHTCWVGNLWVKDCLYDRHVTGPSVHPLHDSACLSVSLKWSCLVSQTVKGWRQKLSRNAVLVCKNKPSGQRYLKRIYIKQLQKQASVNVDRWCNEATPWVWYWSFTKLKEMKSKGFQLWLELIPFIWSVHCSKKRKKRRSIYEGFLKQVVEMGKSVFGSRANRKTAKSWHTYPVAGTL